MATKELRSFFSGKNKTIQRSYNFLVTLIDNPNIPQKIPTIKDWHVRTVSIPQYTFKKEVLKYGPASKTFPIFDSEGLDFRIEFEEDENGTITSLIQTLQSRIMYRDGLFNNPGKAKLTSIVVSLLNFEGDVTLNYTFIEPYFLNADPISYDYSANDSIRYVVTFGCDRYEIEYVSSDNPNIKK